MPKKPIVETAAGNAVAGRDGAVEPSSDSAAVAAAAERLRVAMIDPTPAALDGLVADELSYGHSSGKIDSKASFIGDLMNGKSDFVAIAITDQTIEVVDSVAVVRHALDADINDAGKPGRVSLNILGIWQKQAAHWKLLARQAVRLPTP